MFTKMTIAHVAHVAEGRYRKRATAKHQAGGCSAFTGKAASSTPLAVLMLSSSKSSLERLPDSISDDCDLKVPGLPQYCTRDACPHPPNGHAWIVYHTPFDVLRNSEDKSARCGRDVSKPSPARTMKQSHPRETEAKSH